jgi:anti-sigma factor RsiW
LLDEVIGYHRVYARETTHLVEVPAVQKDELVGWLSDRIGREVVVPDLSAERLKFVGGRMLVANGRPLAQLLYARPGEPPVAVCVTRTSEPPLRLAIEERAGLRLASWNEGGYAYVVVGTVSADRMRRLADRVSASFTPNPAGQYGEISRGLSRGPA